MTHLGVSYDTTFMLNNGRDEAVWVDEQIGLKKFGGGQLDDHERRIQIEYSLY
jgi:hypothetical protein